MPLVLAPATDAPAQAPEGCAREGERWVCQWSFTETPEGIDGTGSHWREFAIPAFPRTLASLTLYFEGENYGWYYAFFEVTKRPDDFASYERLSYSFHGSEREPQRGDDPRNLQRGVFREETAHAFPTRPDATYVFGIDPTGDRGAHTDFVGTRASAGEFRITYVAEALPEGGVPERPAATRDDPHVVDGLGDSAREEAYDLVSFWFDDARVGDGLFEAHLAVRDLASFEPDGVDTALWTARFLVADRPYFVRWGTFRNSTDDSNFFCQAGDYSANGDVNVLSAPRCTYDATSSTFTAQVAERVVGSPADGRAFDHIELEALRWPVGSLADEARAVALGTEEYVMDDARVERYPFALGGPAVWDELNPRLAVAEAPWYSDPLAAQNLPNTLQVLGAIAATGTFLAGLVVVRRHRAVTRRLLREVEDAARRHDGDAREALLALGRIQSAVSDLFHAGKITDAQYQVVTQRIALEATRFALARELTPARFAP